MVLIRLRSYIPFLFFDCPALLAQEETLFVTLNKEKVYKNHCKSITIRGKITNKLKLTPASLSGHWSLSGGRGEYKEK